MVKGISIKEVLQKLDNYLSFSIGDYSDYNLSLREFKRIMMVVPENYGPVITSERSAKEKYKLLQEFAIINQTGRINKDLFEQIRTGKA